MPARAGVKRLTLACEWRVGVINDLALQRNVLDELEFEPSVKAAHIGVTANTPDRR
jgi:hypothetical protein